MRLFGTGNETRAAGAGEKIVRANILLALVAASATGGCVSATGTLNFTDDEDKCFRDYQNQLLHNRNALDDTDVDASVKNDDKGGLVLQCTYTSLVYGESYKSTTTTVTYHPPI